MHSVSSTSSHWPRVRSQVSEIKRSALVHYSAEEMYELVNAVDRYQEFLPWCRSSSILSSSDTEMVASIDMAKGPLQRSFTTRNRLQPGRRIDIELENGPFRYLRGYWMFEPLKTPGACRISLQLEFEFDSAMMSVAARPVFTQIANSLVEAFTRRAEQVHGKRI